MNKLKWFILGIAVFFLMGQTPEYLFRDLDMSGYNIFNIDDFINTNHVEWEGGAEQMITSYYESNGVNDNLYGFFSMPVRVAGGKVYLDSLFLCIWTQAAADGADIHFSSHECDGTAHARSVAMVSGIGSTGWIDIQILDSAMVIQQDQCYYYWLDCTNDGATDIRVRYCTRLYYHTID